MTEENKKTDFAQTEEVEQNEPVLADEETASEKSEAAEETDNTAAMAAEFQKKLNEVENRYFRLQADFDNYRRRVKLDTEAAEKYRAQNLISDILPTLDNFERALSVEVDGEQAASLKQGMEMVYRGLLGALKKEGLQPIEAVGKPFDPNYHQAVMQVDDSAYESNTVVEEFQKGYLLKDRVIRHSMVKVNQ
ncbi:nucleotide exchange factor GrpE [Bacillus sp. B-jedd]|uniref:nucleotide exchange factor GrpE n=1 Tax=Bacillus sp. B-jedd TaxID=1476857 RepID=UPI0005156B43|nr:nucleotide exchange factor GrpE [Bacillus sp. B-jedd]CEG27920.1 heat shock protein GrpE [Bacillus sp. B-jedd]